MEPINEDVEIVLPLPSEEIDPEQKRLTLERLKELQLESPGLTHLMPLTYDKKIELVRGMVDTGLIDIGVIGDSLFIQPEIRVTPRKPFVSFDPPSTVDKADMYLIEVVLVNTSKQRPSWCLVPGSWLGAGIQVNFYPEPGAKAVLITIDVPHSSGGELEVKLNLNDFKKFDVKPNKKSRLPWAVVPYPSLNILNIYSRSGSTFISAISIDSVF